MSDEIIIKVRERIAKSHDADTAQSVVVKLLTYRDRIEFPMAWAARVANSIRTNNYRKTKREILFSDLPPSWQEYLS